MPKYLLSLKIEKLEEGVYLATSDTLHGLVAQGRTIAETIEIAHDVAKKLIESYIEHEDPLLAKMVPAAKVVKNVKIPCSRDGMTKLPVLNPRDTKEIVRTMLEVKPSLKQDTAVELYKSEKVSLSRAAEISGTSLEGFKDLLELKGMKRVVAAPTEDKMRLGVDLILGSENECFKPSLGR